MLAVTPTASQVIHELVARRGLTEGAGLRIAPTEEPGGAFTLGVAAAPEADDEVVPVEDLGVFLEPRAAEALDGKTLDAGVGPEGEVSFSVVDPGTE
jgi:iron-sulfur cluster assembly protein